MPTIKQTRMRFVIVPERLGENQELYPLHELGRGQVGETGFHMLKDGDRVAIATGPGTHKYSALNFTWVTQAQLLGDDRPHRNPHYFGGLDSQRIHQASIIVSHHGTGVVSFGFVCEADTPIVDHDAAIVRAPVIGVNFPDGSWGGDSHDENKRFAGSAFLVVHLNSVGFD